MTNIPRDHQMEIPGPDRIRDLVRIAGPRPMPEAGQMASARAAAHDEWLQLVKRRGQQRRWWRLAAVAVAAAATIIAVRTWARDPFIPPPREVVATFEHVKGAVSTASPGGGFVATSEPGLEIRTGDRVEVSDSGRASLEYGGNSLRLDNGTAIEFGADQTVTLERGAVYVDSPRGPAGGTITIGTPLGRVRHIGTQFEVRLRGGSIHVRVREGTVVVEEANGRWMSGAGEALVVTRGRAPEKQKAETSGPAWDWVSELAPPFRLEGASLAVFLQWMSREQGWRWEPANKTVQSRIDRTVLHGSIDGLTPAEALEAVLPTCGLTSRREGDRIIVDVARQR